MNAPVRPRRGDTALGGGSAARVVVKRRCAVYTRKSSEEGLDMEFNSLDAQRESCENYIASQKAEGWVLVPDDYDDGGISGGTLERPALKRLLADIEAGRVDVVVVYKIDRLSRSLMDFAKLVDVFERNEVTFVSVTQQFSTTTSMGKLTLNILFSFAQFEREVIGERIRDKFAASRKKGMWMGGWAPLGYRVENRRLVIDEAEAEKVRWIFTRYVQTGSVTTVVRELTAEGFVNRYGQTLDKGRLYKLLNNRVYLGEAVHKGTAYPGEHEAIVSQSLWDRVHAVMAEGARAKAGRTRAQTPALLKGIIFDAEGRAMSPSHTRKGQRLYRYYVSQSVIRGVGHGGPPRSTHGSGASAHHSGTEHQPLRSRHARPGRRRRGGGHGPASPHAPLARDHRRDLARRPARPSRPDRGRGPRRPRPLRPALGRTLPRRADPHRSAPRRPRRHCRHRHRHPPPCRWARHAVRRDAECAGRAA